MLRALCTTNLYALKFIKESKPMTVVAVPSSA